MPITSGPVPGCHWTEPVSVFAPPLQVFKHTGKLCVSSPLLYRLNSPSSLSLSCYEMLQSLGAALSTCLRNKNGKVWLDILPFKDWFKQPVSQLSYFTLFLLYSSIFFPLLPNLSSVPCNISTTIQSYKLLTDPICLATTYTSRSCQACSSRHTHLQAKRNIFKWSLKLLLDKQQCTCTMSQMWLISTRG